MSSRRIQLCGGLAVAAATLGFSAAVAVPAQASTPARTSAKITVVASGLNQPKKLSFAPNGDLLVALSGNGVAPTSCTDGTQVSCLNTSGAIDQISRSGVVRTLVGRLPSVSGGGAMAEATGPAQARYVDGQLQVLFQNVNINARTGRQSYGPGGALLGDLVRYNHGRAQIEAAFGPFEARHNPDRGEGTGVALGQDSAIDSDPYAFVPYRGGFVVADAAGDDLLYVSRTGAISVLAVFPTITEVAPPGSLGPTQTTPVTVQAQPVPDSVAVGPDGALYVGELGGFPFNAGTSSVYRVVPGHQPQRVASGFSAIGDIAFDQHGNLLVLEIDHLGLADAFSATGLPSPGAIIAVGRNGQHTTLASAGLEFPTGMAVARDGSIYVSNYGVLSATGGPGGLSGQLAHVTFGH